MREIKLKARDKKNHKRHTDWSALFPWGTRPADTTVVEVGIMPDYFEFVQYTGLKDKNGKEIYEGDIVKVKRYSQEKLLTVEWLEMIPCCGCCVENHGPGWNFDDNVPIEVVGNIYENPTEVI